MDYLNNIGNALILIQMVFLPHLVHMQNGIASVFNNNNKIQNAFSPTVNPIFPGVSSNVFKAIQKNLNQ